MKSEVLGAPAFAHVKVRIDPGEYLITESGAMATMSTSLDRITKFNGGIFKGILRRVLGGESIFINYFINRTQQPHEMTIVPGIPGDIKELELNNTSICLQAGAFLACTPNVKLGVKWAGLASWFSKEGLFKLVVSGQGRVWFGAYGGLQFRKVDGLFLVDTAHLVAYEPQLKLGVQLAGGLFSSFFGGEGFVTKVSGKGTVVIQTRSMAGMAGWLNPKLPR